MNGAGDCVNLISEIAGCTIELIETLSETEEANNKEELIKKHIKTFIRKQHVKVRDFENGLEWFNVSHPLSIHKELKGKIVILDFFTYCCINCLHILPDLHALETEFSVESGIVVVGVHSAKFDNEKDSANILAAVQRYGIRHPVVNDADGILWGALGIPCWPTLLILGPNGQPLFLFIGEGHRENLLLFVREALSFFRDQGELSSHTIQLQPAFRLLPSSSLLFPGKVACTGNLLAIADTGHNRIIIASTDGKIEHVIGGTTSGFVDGNFIGAQFHSPQGLVFIDPCTLLVADTENHAIREVNLKTKHVKTLVGTGNQGMDKVGGQVWTDQVISSPWDLCVVTNPMTQKKDVVLIAMAGCHQIWALFLEDSTWWKGRDCVAGTCLMVAGSGKEENRNNSYPHVAGFAQPSGISASEELQSVFIADSESSSIRSLSLGDGKVQAVAGGDRSPTNLFAYGDVDGKRYEAKLQHPLGLCWSSRERVVYVADSYNHKIKNINIETGECSTFLGNGKPGDVCGAVTTDIQFNEPGGLCINEDGTRIYVADTNNHSIKVVNLKEMFVNQLIINTTEPDISTKAPYDIVENYDVGINPEGGSLTIKLKVDVGEQLTLTEGAPQKWNLQLPDDSWSADKIGGDYLPEVSLSIAVPRTTADTSSILSVYFKLFTCVKGSQCTMKHFGFQVNVNHKENYSSEETLEICHLAT